MTLRINGSTSGYTEIDAPAVAGSNTLVLPTGNGSSGQVLSTNGSGALSWATVVQPSVALTAATSVASTSGTSIDFTGIPSGVKRITVIFDGVSTNGSSVIQVQLGTSSGITTTGYVASCGITDGGSVGTTAFSSGFGTADSGFNTYTESGNIIITNRSSNNWVASFSLFQRTSSARTAFGGGSVSLASTLDRVRITTVNGTDTFDAGSINIMYEG